MNAPDVTRRRLPGRSPSLLLAVAAAFLAGVLVTALAVPDRKEVVEAGAAGPGGTGSGVSGSGAGVTPGSAGAGGTTGSGAGAQGGGAAGAPGSGGAGAGAVDPAAAGGDPAAGGAAAPGGGQGAAAGQGGGGATAPGVTASAITIGFGLPDLGAIGALGPGYDQGDPKQHIEGILAGLRAEGRLPVHGRDIKPVYSSYNILSADEQRATCEAFGNDVAVFAVIAVHDFGDGNECTAREFQLPTFTSDGSSDAVHARSAPNLFTMQMTSDRLLRNFVAWADKDGLLKGKRIGVYYGSEPEQAQVVRESLIKPLKALGHEIVAEVTTATPETGGPTDSVAVQRFSSNRVDTAILVVSAIAKTNFYNQADRQGFRPRYLENDIGFSTTDTATSTYPPDHFDGSPAITGMRFGEPKSNIPEPAEATWCRDVIRKHAGRDIPRTGRDAEYIAANQACDEIRVVLHGIEQAGPNLTRASFIAGVETIRDRPAGVHGNLTFAPNDHDGGGSWRRIDWSKGCRCWQVKSDMSPLLVN